MVPFDVVSIALNIIEHGSSKTKNIHTLGSLKTLPHGWPEWPGFTPRVSPWGGLGSELLRASGDCGAAVGGGDTILPHRGRRYGVVVLVLVMVMGVVMMMMMVKVMAMVMMMTVQCGGLFGF